MDTFVASMASIVGASAPLIYVTMGETISEKSGMIDLSLEGSLRLSALTGFVIALWTGTALAGFGAAAAVGALFAAVIAFGNIKLKINQIALGFVLALFGIALASFLGDSFVGQRGESVPPLPIPGLSKIPVIGEVFFDHNLMVYGSFIVVAVTWWYFYRTRPGLNLQGVGERPAAAFSRGVPVNRLRAIYTIIGGAMAGIAGAAYSLDVQLGWRETLTLNLGWIALAIVIFGGWHPVRVAIGCYLFGALQVLALQLQDVFPAFSQVLPIAPFPLMILALVLIYAGWLVRLGDRWPKARGWLVADPPSAIGTIFERE